MIPSGSCLVFLAAKALHLFRLAYGIAREGWMLGELGVLFPAGTYKLRSYPTVTTGTPPLSEGPDSSRAGLSRVRKVGTVPLDFTHEDGRGATGESPGSPGADDGPPGRAGRS